jgi:hypothetical protein
LLIAIVGEWELKVAVQDENFIITYQQIEGKNVNNKR